MHMKKDGGILVRYYVVADVHGYYSIMRDALEAAGFFTDPEPHKLIMLGDLFDRGTEAKEIQRFVLDLMKEDAVILIRGNHEDLFESLVVEDGGIPYSHHLHNGTYDTALQLTGFTSRSAREHNFAFADKAMETPYYRKIMPAMLDYYETERYIFVHGWLPCLIEQGQYCSISDWRNSTPREWAEARWINGIKAAQTFSEAKTVVCGHWHTSFGHSQYEQKGPEFGEGADFSPYYGPGVIGLDACTALSGKLNVIVLED